MGETTVTHVWPISCQHSIHPPIAVRPLPVTGEERARWDRSKEQRSDAVFVFPGWQESTVGISYFLLSPSLNIISQEFFWCFSLFNLSICLFTYIFICYFAFLFLYLFLTVKKALQKLNIPLQVYHSSSLRVPKPLLMLLLLVLSHSSEETEGA